jgi:hypothetical protein
MNTRRNFFKVLGLGAGVAATGVAGAVALVAATPGKSEAVKQLEKNTGYNITFIAAYGEEIPSSPINTHSMTGSNITTMYSPYSDRRFVPGTRKDVQASIKVGPDGNMYLKQNGKWTRIVTE